MGECQHTVQPGPTYVFTSVMGKGLSASTPVADVNNTGTSAVMEHRDRTGTTSKGVFGILDASAWQDSAAARRRDLQRYGNRCPG